VLLRQRTNRESLRSLSMLLRQFPAKTFNEEARLFQVRGPDQQSLRLSPA
jgi:hypothetical protein